MLVHIFKFPLPKVSTKKKISPTFFLSPCLIRIFTQKSGTRVLCHERSAISDVAEARLGGLRVTSLRCLSSLST